MATQKSLIGPTPPTAPDAPAVPQADRLRATVRIPRSSVPDYEDAAFLQRFANWQAAVNANGSILEYIVWEFLVFKRGMIEGIDFYYQYPVLGGRTFFGGFVIDFFIPPALVLQPQGAQWHLKNPRDRAKLRVEKGILGARGITVVYLFEDDLLTRPDFTLNAALRGQQTNTHRDDL